MWTIWGTTQSIEHIVRGVMTCSTAGHGGMLIAPGYAKAHIPADVLARTPFQNGYYQFEEDCEINIPLFYAPKLNHALACAWCKEDLARKAALFAYNTAIGMAMYFPEQLAKHPERREAFLKYTESQEEWTEEEKQKIRDGFEGNSSF